MIARLRPLFVPAILTLAAVALLVGLGTWQVRRLAWKTALLAQIETRTKAPPVPIPPMADWPHLQPADYEYRHVTLSGTFANDKEADVFRGTDAGPGYLVMTPLALTGGGTVLVNRGFVPETLKDPSTRRAGEPTGEVHLTGLMRGPEPRNLFTPPDDPGKDQFFTRDPRSIAAAFGLRDVAPFTVDADATPNPGGWPKGGATALAIPNNHLTYALTWFGLALVLIGVFFSFVRRRLAETRGSGTGEHAPAPATTIRG